MKNSKIWLGVALAMGFGLTVGCRGFSSSGGGGSSSSISGWDGFGNEGGASGGGGSSGGSSGGGTDPWGNPIGGGGGGTGGGGTGGSGGDGNTGLGEVYSNGHPITYLSDDPTTLTNEDEVLSLVNAHRATIGKNALVHEQLMRQTARGHSAHMSADYHNFFDHFNPEGDGPTQRYNKAGGTGGCAENIAMGYSTASSAFNGWMSSPGHKANIEGDYTKTGIGWYSGNLWTQMFQ